MSLPPSQGGLGLAVVVVDTSNEIAGRCSDKNMLMLTPDCTMLLHSSVV
jgi:hypothetical protein